MKRSPLALAALVVVIGASHALRAQDRIETLRFDPGASSRIVTGSVKGYEGIGYSVAARAGQAASVTLRAINSSCYFNVVPPGGGEAIFIGSQQGKFWRGTLPATGDYVIQIYLMRNAARRHETCRYSLTVEID